MNKLLLLGHPSSAILAVYALLQEAGMQAALPSKREQFLPAQIIDTLCQAHQCPAIDAVNNEEDFSPVQAGPVWHGLALDLILGNIEQPLWGWADARNIYWLDYWTTLDPHSTIVMVYDHPTTALEALGQQNLSPLQINMAVAQALENWQAYNGAMLRFFSRRPERCILVDAANARSCLDQYLSELQDKLHGKTPVALKALPLSSDDSNPVCIPNPHSRSSEITQSNELVQAIALTEHNPADVINWLESGGAFEQQLRHDIVQGHPEALQIYSELQAASSVQRNATPAHNQAIPPAQAWLDLVQQRKTLAHITRTLYQHIHEQETKRRSLENTLALETQRLEQEKIALENTLRVEAEKAQSCTEESKLLLTQLHQVQEELEQLLLSQKDTEQKVKEAQNKAAELLAEKRKLEQTLVSKTTELNQKEAALQAEIKNKAQALAQSQTLASTPAIKKLEEENELLLNQLHQVQEELERYYLENQRLKSGKTTPQTPISVAKPRPYGAAERVKQHLSYRLGATMITHSRSPVGWMRMPFALLAEARSYRRNLQSKSDEAKLPPLHTYADAHEADRVKQHLSYRLGQTLLKHGKTPWGWLYLPFAISSTVRRFRKDRA